MTGTKRVVSPEANAAAAGISSNSRALRELIPVALCVLSGPIAFWLVNPFIEIGVNDDWVYAHMALVWARTGHFQFDGMSATAVGLHAFWGMLFIRLFGFSFSVLRASMIPVFSGCTLATYGIARWIGASRREALLAGAAFTFSPLFLPVGTAFMTDGTAVLMMLLSVLCLLRASANKTGTSMLWLALAMFLGVAAGTVRQVFWGAPLMGAAAFIYLNRRDRKAVLGGVASLLLTGGCIAFLLHWFHSQKYANIERVPLPHSVADVRYMADQTLTFGLTLGFLCLPAVVYLLSDRAVWRKSLTRILWAVALTAALLLRFPALAGFPWMSNILTKFGVLGPNAVVVGDWPVTIPERLGYAIQTVTVALLSLLLVNAVTSWIRSRGRACDEATPNRRLEIFATLTIPFAAAYLLLLALRGILDAVFDRYLLPVFALALIGLIGIAARKRVISFGPAYTCVFVMALYAIATTHDSYRLSEAQAKATAALTSRRIPRECISAGYVYDGWTELEDSGYIPALAETRPPRNTPIEPFFLRWTPDVIPKYYVVSSRQNALAGNELLNIPYSTWMPPWQRDILVQVDPLASCPKK